MDSLKEIKVIERDEARFEITLSHKDVEVKWFKNGAKIARTKNIDFGSQGFVHWLVFHEASLDDDAATIAVHAEEEKCSATIYVEGTEFSFQVLY